MVDNVKYVRDMSSEQNAETFNDIDREYVTFNSINRMTVVG